MTVQVTVHWVIFVPPPRFTSSLLLFVTRARPVDPGPRQATWLLAATATTAAAAAAANTGWGAAAAAGWVRLATAVARASELTDGWQPVGPLPRPVTSIACGTRRTFKNSHYIGD